MDIGYVHVIDIIIILVHINYNWHNCIIILGECLAFLVSGSDPTADLEHS